MNFPQIRYFLFEHFYLKVFIVITLWQTVFAKESNWNETFDK